MLAVGVPLFTMLWKPRTLSLSISFWRVAATLTRQPFQVLYIHRTLTCKTSPTFGTNLPLSLEFQHSLGTTETQVKKGIPSVSQLPLPRPASLFLITMFFLCPPVKIPHNLLYYACCLPLLCMLAPDIICLNSDSFQGKW
jgi:hypothetical protein